jgi:hypothetical protein
MARVIGQGAKKIKRISIVSQIVAVILSIAYTILFGYLVLSHDGYGFLDVSEQGVLILALAFFFLATYTLNDLILHEHFSHAKDPHGRLAILDSLQSLSDSYAVIELPDNPSNVLDLIITGPTGVYAIHTEGSPGTYGANGKDISKDGKPIVGLAAQVYETTMSLHETLQDTFVSPMVALAHRKARDLSQGHTIEHVRIAHRKALPLLIQSGRKVLEEKELPGIENRVQEFFKSS